MYANPQPKLLVQKYPDDDTVLFFSERYLSLLLLGLTASPENRRLLTQRYNLSSRIEAAHGHVYGSGPYLTFAPQGRVIDNNLHDTLN